MEFWPWDDLNLKSCHVGFLIKSFNLPERIEKKRKSCVINKKNPTIEVKVLKFIKHNILTYIYVEK